MRFGKGLVWAPRPCAAGRRIDDAVLAIHRHALPRWLARPDTTLSQLMAQSAAELREAVMPSAPTIH